MCPVASVVVTAVASQLSACLRITSTDVYGSDADMMTVAGTPSGLSTSGRKVLGTPFGKTRRFDADSPTH